MTRLPQVDIENSDALEEDYFEYHFDRPGSEPGTLHIDPDAPPSTIILIDYNKDRAIRKTDLTAAECAPYMGKESVSWIDVQGLGSEMELKELGTLLKLHPLLLEDIVNVPQRPKVDDYNKQLVILVQMAIPRNGESGFDAEQVSFVLGKNYLLTFQEQPNHDCFDAVRDRLRSNKGKVRRMGVDYLTYLLLDSLIDNFFPVLEDYGDRIEEIEGEAVLNPSAQTLEKIYKLRRELLALRRAIWPLQSVMITLMRNDSKLIGEDVEIYFRDCHDHVIQLLEIIGNYRELSSSLMDAYMSAINNRMNDVMKLLTVISTIFIPLTFIAGVYGMNFQYMPELTWHWGYFVCLGVMLAIAIALITFFWRRGWLKSTYPTQKPLKKRKKKGR